MGRQTAILLYVLAMVVVVVGVDVLFFRNWFWERLMMNVGIVLVFGAFYLRFLRSPEPRHRHRMLRASRPYRRRAKRQRAFARGSPRSRRRPPRGLPAGPAARSHPRMQFGRGDHTRPWQPAFAAIASIVGAARMADGGSKDLAEVDLCERTRSRSLGDRRISRWVGNLPGRFLAIVREQHRPLTACASSRTFAGHPRGATWPRARPCRRRALARRRARAYARATRSPERVGRARR